jgi:hypothetical protein
MRSKVRNLLSWTVRRTHDRFANEADFLYSAVLMNLRIFNVTATPLSSTRSFNQSSSEANDAPRTSEAVNNNTFVIQP